ncbi:MAG: rhamnulokinase [Bryobacteraceae bacterium]|nr:rhamnulokinase [Bryobacteraceae bacterium]
MKRYLALDLGAESGRAVLGSFDGYTLGIEEVHRFPNEPVRTDNELHWDVLRLWHEIQRCLRATASAGITELDGVGVDTWGVDFGLFGEGGALLGNPFHYRDTRADGVMDRVFARVPADQIYAATGIQFMQINSLYQLYAAMERTPKLLDIAESLLTMPDLFNYWLTGVMKTEFSIATTTQMYDPVAGDWARSMLQKLGLPVGILKEVIQPGTILGPLKPDLLCGLRGANVIAPAGHDTGSAVAAIAMTPSTVYISSGTWSLMGAEVSGPIITEETRRLNFTNEGGVGGTIRLLKNIMGMWLLQGCRKQWSAEGREFDYATLVGLARPESSHRSIVDPDHPSFLHPADMTSAIREYCRDTGQPSPAEPADYVQLILESLALKYRYVVDCLEQITGQRYTDIRVVGGGARNRTLNQFTADASGCRVIAGPIEATALGNIAMQMVATGAVGSVREARLMIDGSFPTEVFDARDRSRWDGGYARMKQMIEATSIGESQVP